MLQKRHASFDVQHKIDVRLYSCVCCLFCGWLRFCDVMGVTSRDARPLFAFAACPLCLFFTVLCLATVL